MKNRQLRHLQSIRYQTVFYANPTLLLNFALFSRNLLVSLYKEIVASFFATVVKVRAMVFSVPDGLNVVGVCENQRKSLAPSPTGFYEV